MTASPLPAEGPDRDIFLVALRHYSEACEAPELHPSCPFSAPTPDGRACGEECMDLLGRYNAPPLVEAVALGDGMALLPVTPRPRRLPAQPLRPFDAGEIARREEGLDLPYVSMSTVLRRLWERFTADPETHDARRRYEITELLEELSRRGVDSDKYVRHVFALEVAIHVFAKSLVPMAGNIDNSDPLS